MGASKTLKSDPKQPTMVAFLTKQIKTETELEIQKESVDIEPEYIEEFGISLDDLNEAPSPAENIKLGNVVEENVMAQSRKFTGEDNLLAVQPKQEKTESSEKQGRHKPDLKITNEIAEKIQQKAAPMGQRRKMEKSEISQYIVKKLNSYYEDRIFTKEAFKQIAKMLTENVYSGKLAIEKVESFVRTRLTRKVLNDDDILKFFPEFGNIDTTI